MPPPLAVILSCIPHKLLRAVRSFPGLIHSPRLTAHAPWPVQVEFCHPWSRFWLYWHGIFLQSKHFISPSRVDGKTDSSKRESIADDGKEVSTKQLPAVARALIHELRTSLIRDGVFPADVSSCGLVLTSDTTDQLPHVDNHYRYDTHFFRAAGNYDLLTTKVWNSVTRKFEHAPATDDHWVVASHVIHKGSGAPSPGKWALYMYGTVGFSTLIEETTNKVPASVAPTADEDAVTVPTTEDIVAVEATWARISDVLMHAQGVGRAMARAKATPDMPASESSKRNSRRVKAKRAKKRQRTASNSDEVLALTPTQPPLADGWLRQLHDDMGFVHVDGARSSERSSGSGGLRVTLVKGWAEVLATIPLDAVRSGETNAYNRGLFAARPASAGDVLAVYMGGTFVSFQGAHTPTPEAVGAEMYTMYARAYSVSVTEKQAENMWSRAIGGEPWVARCMGWAANHRSKTQTANATKSIRRIGEANVAVIEALHGIAEGKPIIMDYQTAATPMEAQIDRDLDATYAAVDAILVKYPLAREVPRDDDSVKPRATFKATDLPFGKKIRASGFCVRPSNVPSAGLGLFVSTAQAMWLINLGNDDVLTCKLGSGCGCLHVPAEDIDGVTDMAKRLMPAFAYAIVRQLDDGSYLFAYPPSQHQMAAIFAANAASDASRFNGGLCGKLELEAQYGDENHEGVKEIVGVDVSIHATCETKAWAVGLALGKGSTNIEVYLQSYGSFGSDTHTKITEKHRRDMANPYVPLMLDRGRNPHNEKALDVRRHHSLWLAPLRDALAHAADPGLPWRAVNGVEQAQFMLIDGRPTPMCDAWVWAVRKVAERIAQKHSLAFSKLSGVSWRDQGGKRTHCTQPEMRSRLADRRATHGTTMITFGRGTLEGSFGKYAAALYVNTDVYCYTLPLVTEARDDLTSEVELEPVSVSSDPGGCVWIQHAMAAW